MTDMLCQVCNYEIFNDKDELYNYLVYFRKDYDRSLYYKYTINNINLNNINKIFDYYIRIQNETFNFYFIKCIFEIQFNIIIIANIEINNHYSSDYINIENYLSLYLNSCQKAGYKISNITHMIINITSCRCNIKYNRYVDKPMSMLERRMNYIISKNPSLKKDTNHPLLRKYSYIPFNNI